MPKFKYKAVSAGGANVNGVIEAYDEFEAVDKIKQEHRVIVSIHQVDEDKSSFLNINITTPKIKEKSLALMCSQFSIVVKSGMPIVRSVELIADQTTDKELKKILKKVAEDVATGYGLAQSFENKGGKMLPTSLIETIRAGEESGSLDVSFERLFTYFEKSAKTKDKVKSAMMYPIFLSVIAVVVIMIVLVVAMPVFIEMFEGFGSELPAITQLLINMSDFFVKYWLLIVGIMAGLIIALKMYSNSEHGRLVFAKTQLKIPILGKVAEMKGASQLANTMATMLASGLNIVRATYICSKIIDNYHFSIQLSAAIAGLEQGKPLGECLSGCECFPSLLVEMASVGDETGTLEDTLDTIGQYYDSETAIASERALAALQPAITVVLGIVIGFVVIALYMPMFTMYSGM